VADEYFAVLEIEAKEVVVACFVAAMEAVEQFAADIDDASARDENWSERHGWCWMVASSSLALWRQKEFRFV